MLSLCTGAEGELQGVHLVPPLPVRTWMWNISGFAKKTTWAHGPVVRLLDPTQQVVRGSGAVLMASAPAHRAAWFWGAVVCACSERDGWAHTGGGGGFTALLSSGGQPRPWGPSGAQPLVPGS